MWEFTLGGSGSHSKDFDTAFGGVNFSAGYHLQNGGEVVWRQSANYSNPENSGSTWNGSTRVAFDQHLAPWSSVRPFVGINFGGSYGRGTRDTFASGLEAGVKFAVAPRTFVLAMTGYDWFFRHAKGISDNFSDGEFNWSVGIGFHF